MTKLRKIFKGEENWDIMYNDQDDILKFTNDENQNSHLKTFQEDKNNPNKSQNPTTYNQFNKITNKLNNVDLNNEQNKNLKNIDNDNIDETDIQELIFNNVEINQEEFEVNEKDYDNFEFDVSMQDNRSEISHQNKKRTFSTAFGKDEDVISQSSFVSKKTKYN
jgi:hypothetical protein